MKYLLLIIGLLLSFSVLAQEENLNTPVEESQEEAVERSEKKPLSEKKSKSKKSKKNRKKLSKTDNLSEAEQEALEEFSSEAEDIQARAKKNVRRAEILYKNQQYGEAIQVFQSTYDELNLNRTDLESFYGQIAFNPDSILLRMAEAYYMDDQYESAKGELLGYLAIKRTPMDSREYFLQASIDYKMQDFADAIDSYTQILDLPKLTDSIKFYSHFYRGISSYQLQYYKDAYDDFAVCTRLKPKRYETHYNMGRSLFREISKVGDMKRTIKILSQALALNAEHIPSLFLRARSYERIKKYKEAMADFEKCISLRPDYEDAHYKKAIMIYRLNKNRATKKVCNQIYEAVKLGSAEALLFQQDFCY